VQGNAAQHLCRLQLSVRISCNYLNMMAKKTRVDSRKLSAQIFEYIGRNDLDAANDLFRHALHARKPTVDPRRSLGSAYAVATVLGFTLLLIIFQLA
jgi:hypothetical protein